MSKYLIIIESPGKIKKFKSSLGKDYDIVASYGHIADLPEKKLSVDIKKDFQATYEISPDKKDVVKNIQTKSKNADIVYLMTDPDREGSAIAWHIARFLPKGTKYKRAVTNSINKKDIINGINNASDIDMDMVYAYEARRILDRLVGYKTSFLTKQATGGISSGRTQSAGLRILAEREKEINDFVPVVYWPIEAELLTKDKEKILSIIKKPKPLEIPDKETAEKICNTLRKETVKVSKFDKKEVKTNPYPPFTTSTMYQAAAAILKWKSDKTAKVAQKLYEAGKCTYHRTDSTYITSDFINEIRNHLSNNYGGNYLPPYPNVFSNKKGSQEAHEACRVTDVGLKEYLSGSADEAKLYEIIWKRTVASQMEKNTSLRISAEFSCHSGSNEYVLSASGSKQLFDGWRKVWDYGSSDDRYVPELIVGDVVDVIDIKTERKETQPPSRYTDASFQKKLENEGIGRPSTYASIVKTLENRKYIENNKNISVTDLGMRVNEFLVDADFCFVDIGFTSDLEEKLDDIANKKITKVDVLKEFWERLKKDINRAKEIKEKQSITEFPCPKCKKININSHLLLKQSRFGPFFSCSNYSSKDKKCDYKAKVGDNGEPIEIEKKVLEYSNIQCPKCGNKLVKRKGKKGEFLGCEKFSSGCQGLYDLEGNAIEFKKKKYNRGKRKK